MKPFLLFILILSPLIIWSQFHMTEGSEIQRSKSESFNGFIGENNLSVFTVDYVSSSKKKKALYIRQYYKNDLNLMVEKDIYNTNRSTVMSRAAVLVSSARHIYSTVTNTAAV